MKKRIVITAKQVDRTLLVFNLAMSVFYFSWWLSPEHNRINPLFVLLLVGEIYHIFMAMSFWQTIWPSYTKVSEGKPSLLNSENNLFFPATVSKPEIEDNLDPSVDVFITVAGEPVEILRKTVQAAKGMDYRNHKVWVLNDSKVANKNNWREIEEMAGKEGVGYVTREIPGGFKAGNVNNGLDISQGEIVVILDTDMVPQKNFLKKIIPYFKDEKVGFVQTPQYYKNHKENLVSQAAWDQQRFFFGSVMEGKNNSNAAFICGTNLAIRRKALEEVGGLDEKNIAEDFLTSLYVHQRGWKSVYIREVLAKGLAPEDLLSYYKQQLRWARGSLEMLFYHNPLFKKGLSWKQKLQYLSSSLYYFNGIVVLIDMVMPLVFLGFGLRAVEVSSASFAVFFLPFIFLNLLTLNRSSGGKLSFRAMAFSQSSWTLQILALKSILFKQKMAFAVTPKQKEAGNYLFLAYPHLGYIGIGIVLAVVAIVREGMSASVATNIAWMLFNFAMFVPFIQAAYDWGGLGQRIREWRVGKDEIRRMDENKIGG